MDWNWDHLRFFLALARHGTLTNAAQGLNVSHTTVLRRIKAFENELGTHLFEKTPDGYQLTNSGESLFSEVRSMELAVSTISRRIVGADQRIEGEVAITTTDTIGYTLLPEILARLSATYPALRIRLRISNDLDDMARRVADIAIRAGKNPPPSLVGTPLGKLTFVPCAARSYLDSRPTNGFPKSTRIHRFIKLDETYDDYPFQKWLLGQLAPGDDVCTVNGLMAAYTMCRAGNGIAMLPRYMADDKDVVKLPSGDPPIANDIWVLTHEDQRNTARIRAAKDFISEALRPIISGST